MKTEDDIRQAVEVMRRGGVILYPTDTVWGIGCDATNAEAVARIYRIKQRDDSKAMICLVDSDARVQRYVRDVPSVAWDLFEYADKPTTLIGGIEWLNLESSFQVQLLKFKFLYHTLSALLMINRLNPSTIQWFSLYHCRSL